MLKSLAILFLLATGNSKITLSCSSSSECPGTERCIFYNNDWRGVCLQVCQVKDICPSSFPKCVELISFKRRRPWRVCTDNYLIRAQKEHIILAGTWVN